jgi:micrococcal nuclease
LNKVFRSDLKVESKAIRLALFIELLVVLLSGVGISYATSVAMGWAVLVGLFGILAGVSMMGSYLWTRYAAQPEVEEKKQLAEEQQSLTERVAYTLQQIGRLEEERGLLDQNEQADLARRNALFQDQAKESHEKRVQLEITHRQTIQTALRQRQQTHLRSGLQAEKLAEADLPLSAAPVWPDILKALHTHQIFTAADLIPEWLVQTGLEPSHIHDLLTWRESLDTTLQTTQPLELPVSENELLQQDYTHQNSQLEQQEIVLKVSLEKDLHEIREAVNKQRERNKTSLSALRSALRGLQEKQMAVTKQQQTFTQVQFSQFFARVLGAALGTPRSTYRIGAGLAHLLVWGLLLLQGGLSLRAAQMLNNQRAHTELIALSPSATPLPAELACLPTETPRQTGLVSRVVDGDTIDVQIEGQDFRVRYLGMDAPEPNQYLGGLALNQNIQLVAGKEVILIRDISETDDFGRLLRYVLVGEVFVNYQLIQAGYARATAYPPDTACQTILESAQELAQANQTGIWQPSSTPLVSATPLVDATEPATPPCACTANLLNCSDFTTHAEAQACYAYCVNQGVGDIHRLDGNGDGMACESLP